MGSADAFGPGTLIGGDFRIIRPLASGGMGSVYVAEQVSTGKQRALKVMHAELAPDARMRERFIQEARVGAQIESEHVVEVVGAGIDTNTGTPWLAMEMLDGLDLAAMVAQRGPLPLHEVREILAQLCHALAAAHRAGVVHRDLKPQNVFVARSRQQNVHFKVKVLDFGIAKVFASSLASTAATGVVGTPLWMAPEQTDPRGLVTAACDVWALGLIAFRLLTARWYWTQAEGEASSVMSLMREVLFEPIVPASARAAQFGLPHLIPRGFDAWFARCMGREPRTRFVDAGEAMAALDWALGGGALSAAYTPDASTMAHPQPPSIAVSGVDATVVDMGHAGDISGVGRMGDSSNADRSFTGAAYPKPAKPVASWVWIAVGALVLLVGGGTIIAGLVVFALGVGVASSSARTGDADVAGAYVIADSSNPGGAGTYRGAVLLDQVGATYTVHWALTQGPDYKGIGIVDGDVFASAYADAGDYAVATYRIDGGTLRGRFAEASAPGKVGEEVLEGSPSLSGAYRIASSSHGLAGTISIRANGAAFELERSAAAGGHHGTGIRRGDMLVVAWVLAANAGGVVLYEIREGVLDGRWAPLGSAQLGAETLRRR